MADTYTLADYMAAQDQPGRPIKGTLQEVRPEQLGQHNLLPRLLNSFGEPSLDVLRRGYAGEATPGDVARAYLETGPVGPFGVASGRLDTLRRALEYHYRNHVNEYGEPLSASHLAHLASMGAIGGGLWEGAHAIGFGDPLFNAGGAALGILGPHIRQTARIYRRLREIDQRTIGGAADPPP
jgi:hypothetical protein